MPAVPSAAAASPQNEMLPPFLRLILPYCLLVLAVFATYGNIFDNAFLFDDDLLIQLDSNLRGWDRIGHILTGSTTSGAMIAGGFYRPVQILLYLVVFQLGSGSTIGFHLLNLCVHCGNACFAYRLGTKLKFKPWGVFLSILLWALHPLHTEAVTYMSATADPLFAFFCLWAIVKLVPDIAPDKIFKIIPLFLLGLFSKETTVMLPLLVMACLFFTDPKRFDIRTYYRTWPLWGITLLYVFWRMHAKGLDGPQTYARLYQMHAFATLKLYADHPLYRLYTFCATLPAYLKLIVWPTGLHMERAFSIYMIPTCPDCAVMGPVLTGICMLALAGWAIWRGGMKARAGDASALPLAWGLLWFGAAHAPDTGILIPMNSLFLEHWMYLPMIGLLLGGGETAARFLDRQARGFKIAASIGLLLFTLTMASLTYAQNKIWHDPASFYNNIFAYGEQSARGHNNLALYDSDQGHYQDAVIQFKQAISISDSYAETRYNLALTYLRMDQRVYLQEAIDNLKRSIELDPNFYRSYVTLGDIYAALGDRDKARTYSESAAELIAQRR